VKIRNLSNRQAALEFNMNYRALSSYCKKSWICGYEFRNVWQSILSMGLIVTFSQFYL